MHTTEKKHVIGVVPEINKEDGVQIKNSHYSCIYLTCILLFFQQFFSILLPLENGVHSLFSGASI
jgi:hypothetical protein